VSDNAITSVVRSSNDCFACKKVILFLFYVIFLAILDYTCNSLDFMVDLMFYNKAYVMLCLIFINYII